METGRKYWTTMIFLGLATVVMGASFVLALKAKLTSQWVEIVSTYFTIGGLVAGVFQAANAYISGSPSQRRDQPSSVTVQAPRAESVTATATTVQSQPTNSPDLETG